MGSVFKKHTGINIGGHSLITWNEEINFSAKGFFTQLVNEKTLIN